MASELRGIVAAYRCIESRIVDSAVRSQTRQIPSVSYNTTISHENQFFVSQVRCPRLLISSISNIVAINASDVDSAWYGVNLKPGYLGSPGSIWRCHLLSYELS